MSYIILAMLVQHTTHFLQTSEFCSTAVKSFSSTLISIKSIYSQLKFWQRQCWSSCLHLSQEGSHFRSASAKCHAHFSKRHVFWAGYARQQGIGAILASMTWVGFTIKTPRKGWSRCSGHLITAHRGWHLRSPRSQCGCGLAQTSAPWYIWRWLLGQWRSHKGREMLLMCGALGCVSQVTLALVKISGFQAVMGWLLTRVTVSKGPLLLLCPFAQQYLIRSPRKTPALVIHESAVTIPPLIHPIHIACSQMVLAGNCFKMCPCCGQDWARWHCMWWSPLIREAWKLFSWSKLSGRFLSLFPSSSLPFLHWMLSVHTSKYTFWTKQAHLYLDIFAFVFWKWVCRLGDLTGDKEVACGIWIPQY